MFQKSYVAETEYVCMRAMGMILAKLVLWNISTATLTLVEDRPFFSHPIYFAKYASRWNGARKNVV